MNDTIKKVKKPKRTRDIRFDLHISQEEYDLIQERMSEAGTANMSAFIRKMALNGYVLHVDLSPVKDVLSLQRRCANNLNQIAASVNTYGGIYPQELTALQKDYTSLWNPLSELIKQLAEIVRL
jgi:Bacterial mobilisation protein (MobC).